MASSHEALIFSSVFPIPAHHTTPTPLATPDLGFTAEGQSFGGVDITSPHLSSRPVAQEIKQNQAWSIATRYLSLARAPFSQNPLWGIKQAPTPDVAEALRYLLVGEGAQASGDEGQGLLDWYVNEVRGHYLACVQPTIQPLWKPEVDCRHAWNVLEETVGRLGQAQAMYLQPLRDHVLPIVCNAASSLSAAQQSEAHSRATQLASKFRRDLSAVVAHSIPLQLVSKALSYVLFDAGCRIFDLSPSQAERQRPTKEDILKARNRTIHLLRALHEVGLAGDQVQRAFAQAMDKLLGQFIVSHHMKVDWYGRASVTKKLRQWIKEGFAPFVTEIMECLSAGEAPPPGPMEIQQWQDMATQRLGRARVDNMFDYVIHWDRSLGAILDLKDYITTPAARSHLALSFSKQLSRRLLHAGATTTHILNVYIYVIRAFNELDPKAVLLDRVAKPIRRHLRDRDDTARIIVSSLLADVQDEAGNTAAPSEDISIEIAKEMLSPGSSHNQHDDHDLDWGNMNWTPDPVDAGPEYRKSKSSDIISSLLSLYDREDFITELKSILAEHLLASALSPDPTFEKEIRLLELFKLRLGEDKLQACEVMLRDVLESRRIDGAIRANVVGREPYPTLAELVSNDYEIKKGTTMAKVDLGEPDLHAQILSSFFWPPLRDDAFRPPPAVREALTRYEQGFERVKDMRKLRWLHALGRATVELRLADRTVSEEVATWQAAVISAFGEEESGGQGGEEVKRSVSQLEEALEMDEELIRNALAFWVGKDVLRETSPGSDEFVVLERLPSSSDAVTAPSVAASASAGAGAPAVAAVKRQEDVLSENMGLYRQFVLGMLTNQGAMPTPRILIMLKMAVPGGFQGGVEELRVLLGGMVEEGILQGSGDVWGMRK